MSQSDKPINRFTTTLKALRKAAACVAGYNKLVRALQGKPFTDDDQDRETHILFAHTDEIPILFILDSNGLDDAVWSLRTCSGVDHDLRLFGVWAARQVQHLMTDQRSLNALDVAERFADGRADEAELDAAWDTALGAQEKRLRQMLNDNGWVGSTHPIVEIAECEVPHAA